MQSRWWLLGFVLVSASTYLAWHVMAESVVASPEKLPAPRAVLLPAQYVGAGSCAAAACHNGHFTNGNTSSEYTLWVTRDPHARAYESLFDERSKLIQKNLQRSTFAHEDSRCLKCHVAPDFDASLEKKAPYYRTDGVSCESCHGAAEHWLNVHHLTAWKNMSQAEKKRQGMRDTQSLAGRAQLCVTCHVGVPGMDVDHDLIAAGHPRLHFEFAAFHAFMPRHWPDAKDRDFEARTWLTGQLVAAQASLELLADRAGDLKKPWPEFAEHDCAACHQNLQFSGVRQQKGFGNRQPGALPWGHSVSLTHRALRTIQEPGDIQFATLVGKLQQAMDTGRPNRNDLTLNARGAAARLKPWITKLDQQPLDLKEMTTQLSFVLTKESQIGNPSADEITQLYLGLAALVANEERMFPDSSQKQRIHVPRTPGLGAQRSYDPGAIRHRLLELKKLGPSRER